MGADTAVRVFPNPYGQLRVIYTFREASGLLLVGAPTAEFTWFAGYTWRIAHCARCKLHLGWCFEGGAEPRDFYGLLKEALARA
jgi:hypothetical protein